MSDGAKPKVRLTNRTGSTGKPVVTYVWPEKKPLPSLGNWDLNITAGNRALHIAANTEQYLPSSVSNFFNKTPTRNVAGKYIAEAFGWSFAPGSGPAGDDMIRYMWKSEGFLGSKRFIEHGMRGFMNPASILTTVGAAASLYFTADLMYQGFKQDGLTGAALGLGESVAWGYASRALVPKVFGATWSGAKAGWATGSFIAGGAGAIEVGAIPGISGAAAAGRLGIGARAAAFAGAGIGAGIGAAIGTLMNPYAWAVAGGIYAVGKIADNIDRKNRAIAKQKQVRGLELGAPMLDQFGTVATLRQRSLSAIQNSHVNGRMALGNEAALLHASF